MPTETSGKQEKELPMISKEALTSFQENKQKIIKETVNRSLKRQEEVEHHGQKAREILIAGLGFMTQNLEVAMTLGEVTFLHDQLNWARDRLPHDGYQWNTSSVVFKYIVTWLKKQCPENIPRKL